MSNFYSIGFGLGFCLSLLIGIVVLVTDSRRAVNRAWAALSLLVAVWFFGRDMMLHSSSVQDASLGQKIAFTGSIYLTVAYLHFVYRYLERKVDFFLITAYAVTTISFFANWFTPFFISRIAEVPVLRYYELAGPIYYLHLVSYLLFPGVGFQLLMNKKKEKGPQTNQLNFLILASNIGFTCGLTTFPLNFGIQFPPIGAPFISLYVLIIAYAILVHRLLDFTLAIRWGLAFAVTVGIVLLVYYGLTALAERLLSSVIAPGLPTLIAASLSVLIFDPLRRTINGWVDHFIFKSPDLNALLEGLGDFSDFKSANQIAAPLSERLKAIWKTEHAGLVMFDRHTASYVPIPENEFSDQVITRRSKTIKQDDFLVRTLATERRLFKNGIVTEEELNDLAVLASPGERTTLWKIRRTLRWYGAAVAAPVMLFDELAAFVILGTKKNKTAYTPDDRKVLTHIAALLKEVVARTANSEETGSGEYLSTQFREAK